MKNANKEPGKKFVQVSLSQEFAADLRAQADSCDRSMAAQLEHWAKIARAIETVIPAARVQELKSGKDASEVLSRVGTYLLQQNPVSLRAKLAAASSPRYGVDGTDPEVAIRIDPDGTETRGRFDAAGDFIPASAATERTQNHGPRSDAKPRTSSAEHRVPARPSTAKGRSRDPVDA